MTKELKIFIITIPTFIILHFLGWWRYYYTTSFYDNIVHMAAGATIVILVYFIKKQRAKNIYVISIIVVIIIGIAWEVFEYIIDHTISQRFGLLVLQQGIIDTLSDMSMNILGGVLMLGIIYYIRTSQQRQYGQ